MSKRRVLSCWFLGFLVKKAVLGAAFYFFQEIICVNDVTIFFNCVTLSGAKGMTFVL